MRGVHSVNGEYVVIEKIQHEILESPIKVYNFQVEKYYTYYVADIGVLVHNMCALKRDIRQINNAANEAGIPRHLRREYGDYVEDSKKGVLIIIHIHIETFFGWQKNFWRNTKNDFI